MDFSEKYVKMCKGAVELQILKWKRGFTEGDWIYASGKIRIVGHDFLHLENLYEKHKTPIFKFALKKEPSIIDWNINSRELKLVDFKTNEYYVEVIRNPIWLPTQDQIQSMMGISCARSLYFDDFYEFCKKKTLDGYPTAEGWKYDTMEQIWLALLYYQRFKKVWDDEREEWISRRKNDDKNPN